MTENGGTSGGGFRNGDKFNRFNNKGRSNDFSRKSYGGGDFGSKFDQAKSSYGSTNSYGSSQPQTGAYMANSTPQNATYSTYNQTSQPLAATPYVPPAIYGQIQAAASGSGYQDYQQQAYPMQYYQQPTAVPPPPPPPAGAPPPPPPPTGQ